MTRICISIIATPPIRSHGDKRPDSGSAPVKVTRVEVSQSCSLSGEFDVRLSHLADEHRGLPSDNALGKLRHRHTALLSLGLRVKLNIAIVIGLSSCSGGAVSQGSGGRAVLPVVGDAHCQAVAGAGEGQCTDAGTEECSSQSQDLTYRRR